MTDHDGPPDQTKLTDTPLVTEWNHGLITNPLPLDPPGLCQRCHKECREFTNVGGTEYCDDCAEMVRDIKSLFRACSLEGVGEP